jgi:hypothetical protein
VDFLLVENYLLQFFALELVFELVFELVLLLHPLVASLDASTFLVALADLLLFLDEAFEFLPNIVFTSYLSRLIAL